MEKSDKHKQKRMREQLRKIEEENSEIRQRRADKASEQASEITERQEAKGRIVQAHFGREIRRSGEPGIQRSVIYSKRMKVPRGKR